MRDSNTYGDGIPFVVWTVMWLLGGVVAVVLTAYDILHPFIDRIVGHDFTNLWTAGKLVWAGRAECVFDANCFRIAEYDLLHLLGLQNYSYPPPALFIAMPFALMSYGVALVLWTLIGAVFFVWCARPWLPRGFPPLLAVLTPAATINIWNGHYSFFLGGLWLLFFRDIDQRPCRAGLSAGLLALKPHLGVMIAATIVKKRRAVIAAVVTVAALCLLSAAAFGPGPWNWFIFGTTAAQQEILTRSSHEFYFRMMPSAYVSFGKGNAGVIAQIVCALAAIALLVRYRQWDVFSAATATFLIVPYTFNYDMTVACLGLAIILFCEWSRLSLLSRAVLFTAFLSPELTYYAGLLVPPVLLAALSIQLRTLAERKIRLHSDLQRSIVASDGKDSSTILAAT